MITLGRRPEYRSLFEGRTHVGDCRPKDGTVFTGLRDPATKSHPIDGRAKPPCSFRAIERVSRAEVTGNGVYAMELSVVPIVLKAMLMLFASLPMPATAANPISDA